MLIGSSNFTFNRTESEMSFKIKKFSYKFHFEGFTKKDFCHKSLGDD